VSCRETTRFPLPELPGGLFFEPGPSNTGLTVALATVVERIVEVKGFMALVMNPRSVAVQHDVSRSGSISIKILSQNADHCEDSSPTP